MKFEYSFLVRDQRVTRSHSIPVRSNESDHDILDTLRQVIGFPGLEVHIYDESKVQNS